MHATPRSGLQQGGIMSTHSCASLSEYGANKSSRQAPPVDPASRDPSFNAAVATVASFRISPRQSFHFSQYTDLL